jgi:hypothetical protein
MSQFHRGARIGGNRVMQIAKSISTERPLSLGEVVFVLVSLRAKSYADLTKEDLLRLVDRAYDAYATASQVNPGGNAK